MERDGQGERTAHVAVVPGSFDPVTLGHVDLIRRAARITDRLHVVVVHNPGKQAILPIGRRVELLTQVLAEAQIDAVVESLGSGLLVDHCRAVGADLLIKGVRSAVDVEYETPMAVVNRDLADIDTALLIGAPGVAHISSSLVRQVAALGGDIRKYVPAAVAAALGSSDPAERGAHG